QRRDHRLADEVDVLALSSGKLPGQRVRSEEAGSDVDRQLAAELARDAQHLAFGLELEPVARLHFNGGDAFGKEAREARACAGEERRLARLARRGHRGDDAAALPGDVAVGDALQPLLELAPALAGEDQMGVAVDESGRHPAATAI